MASRRRSDGRRGSTDAGRAPPRRRCPPRSPCPATTAATGPDSRERSSPRLCARVSPDPDRPSGGSISMVWFCSDTAVTIALTNGTSTSPPVADVTDNNSPAAVCSTSSTLPTSLPSVVTTRKPLELVVVELVGIVDRRQVRGVDEEHIAPQRIRGVRGRRRRPIAPAAGHCARGRIRRHSHVPARRGRLVPAASCPARNGCRGRRCGPRRPVHR